MIRLLLRLLEIKDFEVCQSCETLKQQLEFANQEKRDLTDVLLNIIRPKVYEAPPQEIQPVTATTGLFARRRAILEQKDRESAQVIKQSENLGKPDDRIKEINKLEKELGIDDFSEKKEA